MSRERILKRITLTCRDFTRDLSYHRAMSPYVDNLRTNIWIYTYNNFIDMAVLNWCHLFGNSNDDLHWLKNAKDQNAFREELLRAVDLNFDRWLEYRKTIKDYRNKDVAHIEVRPEAQVPDMNLAIVATSVYYCEALEELKTLGNYDALPNNLNDYYNEVQALANAYVDNHIKDLFQYVDET